MNEWTLVHLATGAVLGWLRLDWQYAVGAAIGAVAIEGAARERIGRPEAATDPEASIADVGAVLIGYVIAAKVAGGASP